MDTPTLITKERLAAIQALRDSGGPYAEVAAGLTRLNSPSVEDYIQARIEPAPPPEPPPSAEYLDALARERRRDEHLAELFAQIARGESLPARNPFEHRAVKELERIARFDPVLSRAVAIALGQDGTLTDAEYDAAICVTAPPDFMVEGEERASAYAAEVEQALAEARREEADSLGETIPEN